MEHLYLFDKNGCASAYGIGTYIRNVITACVNSLIEVTVVTLHVKGSLQCKVDERGIRYINIPSRNEIDLNDKNGQMLFSEYIVSILRGYVSNTDKNIFHLNYTQDYYLAESFKKTWPLDKVVVTIHYFTWCFALFGNTNRLSQIVVKRREELSNFEHEVIYASLFEQRLFQIVDCIIGLSDFACQVLTNFYDIPANKICLIPNGLVDLNEKKDKWLLRQKYGISKDEKMLLFVGRLDNIKGVNYLIEAFKKIVSKEPKAHLYLVGDGHTEMYRSMCVPFDDRFTFCDRLISEELADYYQMSDIGILPSLHEQCSYVGIEMMMHGLPIIGTDSTGLDEMIEEGRNGFKVRLQETEDRIDFPVDELVDKLLYCLCLPSLENFSIQSRKSYLHHYSIQKMQNKLCRLYNILFQKKRSPFDKMPVCDREQQ